MNSLRVLATTAVPVTLAILVTGCSKSGTERLSPVAVPAGLEAFYGQRVDWIACGDGDTAGWIAGEPQPGQLCGYVEAPLDYVAARGHSPTEVPTVRLAATRVPATGTKQGSLVTISGGPGLPGLAMVDNAFPEEVRASYDLIGYDPRGVGRSTPLIKCFPGAAPEDVTDPIAVQEAANRATVANCVRDTGADVLRHIGSDEATDDVDLLRGVLGEPRVNLLAASYGTQIAAMYAVQFPGNYRAAVLDGVVDIAEGQNDMLIGQKRGYQETFDRLAAFCAGDFRTSEHTECPLGDDPAAARAGFQQLLRDTDANPASAPDGPVAAGDVLGATTNGLLWRHSWVPYLRALTDLRHGDGTAVRKLATMFNATGDTESDELPAPRDPTPIAEPDPDPNALTAITCADTADPTTDRAARQPEALARYEAAPYENYQPRPTEFPLEVCDLWPFPGAVHPVTPTRPPGAAPLLFVAQRHDPTTPVSNAERMARYTNSPLLVLEGDGHTLVFSDVNRCVDDAVTRYLRDPDAAQSATCQ